MVLQKKQYNNLKEKWINRHEVSQKNLWDKHKDSLLWLFNKSRELAVGSSLSGLLIFGLPGISSAPSYAVPDTVKLAGNINITSFLISDLSNILPRNPVPLTPFQEKEISDILFKTFGIKVYAEIDGIRLNRSYGLIGKEQHLARYPGDGIYSHFDSDEESKQFAGEGMAPGLGAWGYFSKSKDSMTEQDRLREKYYIAVQTFLAPGFSENVAKYRDFFKYRKMLVVNPENGKAIIAVIGDAGPAAWTGKSLGGSPEVMAYLERVDGSMKGPVIYFFIDDPNDTIPLGPVALS